MDDSKDNDLSCFQADLDLSVVVDPFGCSFVDPLGCSFAEDEDLSRSFEKKTSSCFVSLHGNTPEDLLGCSFSSTNSRSSINDEESIIIGEGTSVDHMLIMTSTPKKCKPTVNDYIDVEEFSRVIAAPSTSNHEKVHCYAKQPSLEQKALEPSNIKADCNKCCSCTSKCMDKVDEFMIRRLRLDYWVKPQYAKWQWLITKLSMCEKRGHFVYIFLDNGLGVCLKAFGFIFKINKNRISKAKALSQRNALIKENSIRGQTVKATECIVWLENHASMYGDRMPHSKDILLPYKSAKRHIYQLYCEEAGEKCVSEATFHRLWWKHFPYLKIKKTKSFSQCTKCAVLQRKFESTLSTATRIYLKKEKDLHNQRQMLERKYYYTKRNESRKYPDEYLSLIIDGMDQSKTDLPHFIGRQAKSINPAAMLKTHITGVIDHGHGTFKGYLDFLQYPHDPNLTINVLLNVFGNILQEKEKLPRVLFLQMDNSPRDNKNKYVLGFCEALVRKQVFHEVHVSFLYVGHTHEDIDASFSRISEKLRRNDAETIPKLLSLLEHCHLIGGLWDVKLWLTDYLNKITGISEPLHFKILKGGSKVLVFYKGQQHQPWQKLDGTFLKALPKESIKKLVPNYSNILDKVLAIKKQIENIKYMFNSSDSFGWWMEFLNDMSILNASATTIWFEKLPKQGSNETPRPDILMDPALEKMLLREVQTPKVYSGKLKSLKSKQKKKTSGAHAGRNTMLKGNRK